MTRHGTVLGTIRYMAPEQIIGHEVDARSDLFSFGAVAFEMLTGRPAFEGDTVADVRAAVLEHDPPPVSRLQPEVPSVVDDVVRRCLAKDVNERFQTAGDVIRELQHACDSIARARTQPPPPTDGSSQLRRWMAGILIAALAGFVGWGSRRILRDGRPELQARFDPLRFCRSTTYPAIPNSNTLRTG